MSEHDEQVALVRWFDMQYPKYSGLLFAIPNGGHRHKLTAVKLKREGVRSGVPDLMLPVANDKYYGLFIELKTKTGRLQPSQKVWLNELDKQGYCAEMCKGWESARELIKNYLGE